MWNARSFVHLLPGPISAEGGRLKRRLRSLICTPVNVQECLYLSHLFVFLAKFVFKSDGIWRKRKNERTGRAGGGGESGLQTHATRPQRPSVNSMSASVCVCAVCYCTVHPWGLWGGGLCMWLPCHILSRAVPPPVTHFLLIHTRGDTGAAPGMPHPLKGRKRRCGSRLILDGPGARREAHAPLSAARHSAQAFGTALVTPANSGCHFQGANSCFVCRFCVSRSFFFFFFRNFRVIKK